MQRVTVLWTLPLFMCLLVIFSKPDTCVCENYSYFLPFNLSPSCLRTSQSCLEEHSIEYERAFTSLL